jgi:hypothetical protein
VAVDIGHDGDGHLGLVHPEPPKALLDPLADRLTLDVSVSHNADVGSAWRLFDLVLDHVLRLRQG